MLATALRMPKKAAAAPAKKDKAERTGGPVLETSKPGDPIAINYLKAGKGKSDLDCEWMKLAFLLISSVLEIGFPPLCFGGVPLLLQSFLPERCV